MFCASTKASPRAPDMETRSLPARSTRWSFPTWTLPCSERCTWMVRMACDLEECSLQFVEACARTRSPWRTRRRTSASVRTPTSMPGPERKTPVLFDSRISILWPFRETGETPPESPELHVDAAPSGAEDLSSRPEDLSSRPQDLSSRPSTSKRLRKWLLYSSTYDTLTRNKASFSAAARSMVSKMSRTARGVMPALPGSPVIVNVLPDPVWPYAKIVAL
mmetsp:Transcript_14727/g.49402  ORF Transcript_14727/g.49402 Transcript_14727/m.49402 type:complete len:220 (-) Transcript_14727:301-960(-)